MQSPSFIARGDIAPSIFVKLDGSDHGIVAAGADDDAVGVSYPGSREAPLPGVTPLAAIDGESCQVFTEATPCEIVAGASITAGDLLKPNASGHAIPATATDKYSARARANAASGEMVKAIVEHGTA